MKLKGFSRSPGSPISLGDDQASKVTAVRSALTKLITTNKLIKGSGELSKEWITALTEYIVADNGFLEACLAQKSDNFVFHSPRLVIYPVSSDGKLAIKNFRLVFNLDTGALVVSQERDELVAGLSWIKRCLGLTEEAEVVASPPPRAANPPALGPELSSSVAAGVSASVANSLRSELADVATASPQPPAARFSALVPAPAAEPEMTSVERKRLAVEIANNFSEAGFSDVVCDFDGTLTKTHTFRQEGYRTESSLRQGDRNKAKITSWFADLELLKAIISECKEKNPPINFHIVSRQNESLIKDILRTVELTYEGERCDFKSIVGRDKTGRFGKAASLSEIATKAPSGKRVFFIDDDSGEVESVTELGNKSIVGILPGKLKECKADSPSDQCGLKVGVWRSIKGQLSSLSIAAAPVKSSPVIPDSLPSQTPLNSATLAAGALASISKLPIASDVEAEALHLLTTTMRHGATRAPINAGVVLGTVTGLAATKPAVPATGGVGPSLTPDRVASGVASAAAMVLPVLDPTSDIAASASRTPQVDASLSSSPPPAEALKILKQRLIKLSRLRKAFGYKGGDFNPGFLKDLSNPFFITIGESDNKLRYSVTKNSDDSVKIIKQKFNSPDFTSVYGSPEIPVEGVDEIDSLVKHSEGKLRESIDKSITESLTDLLQKVYGNAESLIPEDISSVNLDSGPLAFIAKPQYRFFASLNHIAKSCASRGMGALPDIAGNNYLSEFGKKNLGEYLQYLQEIKLISEAQVAGIKAELSGSLDSAKLFHYFLLEFNEFKAVVNSRFDDQARKELSTEDLAEIEIKTDATAIISLSPSPIYPDRFKNDESGKLEVGSRTIYYSESIGVTRSTQEDTFIIIGSAKTGGGWDDAARVPTLLKQEFESLGKRLREAEAAKAQGSTAIVTHYSSDRKLTIASAGDARAVLFIKKPNGAIEWKRLTNDHKPKDVFEEARIVANTGTVFGGRVRDLSGDLAVARSFGDTKYKGDDAAAAHLIEYEPDVFQYDVAPHATGENQCFLLTSCDGLYETANEESYAGFLEKWFAEDYGGIALRAKYNENPAEYLRDCAVLIRSTDNVTVGFCDVTEAPSEAMLMGIFDGHGGAAVSNTLALEFGQSLLSATKKISTVGAGAVSLLTPTIPPLASATAIIDGVPAQQLLSEAAMASSVLAPTSGIAADEASQQLSESMVTKLLDAGFTKDESELLVAHRARAIEFVDRKARADGKKAAADALGKAKQRGVLITYPANLDDLGGSFTASEVKYFKIRSSLAGLHAGMLTLITRGTESGGEKIFQR